MFPGPPTTISDPYANFPLTIGSLPSGKPVSIIFIPLQRVGPRRAIISGKGIFSDSTSSLLPKQERMSLSTHATGKETPPSGMLSRSTNPLQVTCRLSFTAFRDRSRRQSVSSSLVVWSRSPVLPPLRTRLRWWTLPAGYPSEESWWKPIPLTLPLPHTAVNDVSQPSPSTPLSSCQRPAQSSLRNSVLIPKRQYGASSKSTYRDSCLWSYRRCWKSGKIYFVFP